MHAELSDDGIVQLGGLDADLNVGHETPMQKQVQEALERLQNSHTQNNQVIVQNLRQEVVRDIRQEILQVVQLGGGSAASPGT